MIIKSDKIMESYNGTGYVDAANCRKCRKVLEWNSYQTDDNGITILYLNEIASGTWQYCGVTGDKRHFCQECSP